MTTNEIKLLAIETKWANSKNLWVHGSSAKQDIAWLVAEVKRLRGIEIDLIPPAPRIPDGIAGVRDQDAPCEHYAPGDPRSINNCSGDGHYLCQECEELDADLVDK
jgi:hypothetical protein